MFFNPLAELKTGLIPTNTRWCGTQKRLRLRIAVTVKKIWKTWKSIMTSCTRRKCLLFHCHGAHPGPVLTVAGRSWGATPFTNFVERSIMQWKRRSMMSKKPLFLYRAQITFATTCLLQLFISTLACYTHSSALKNSAGEQFMKSSWHLCCDTWMQSFLSYI